MRIVSRSPSELLDDAAIIGRVLDGDIDQFAQIVSRYQAALYRHAVSMVLDREVAADMVQDAFIRAYTNLAACRDRARFRAWLFQTLRHRCLDHLKDKRRQHAPLDEADALIDGGEDPEAGLERVRLRGELLQALAALPGPQREAFVLRYVEGLPYEAMAELLDASVSALKMRVLRAREALAAALHGRHVTDLAAVRLSSSGG